MSAVRSSHKRRSNRSAISSPYARPAPKKSSWSLFGFLSFLNPLKGKTSESGSESSSDVEEDASYAAEEPLATPPHSLSREDEIARELNRDPQANGHALPTPPVSRPAPFTFGPLPTPPAPSLSSASFPFPVSPSPDKNLETATAFLSEKRGKRLSEVEVDGLISLLQTGTPSPKEPFRFSSTVADRSRSPLPQTTPLSSLPSTAPRKTLTKNPNGVYRWEGGGSAKRSRNRYHSPAFGPSRSTPGRLRLGTPTTDAPPVPRMDSKRRRVEEDSTTDNALSGSSLPNGHPIHAKTPSPPPRASAPAPSPTRAAQAYPFPTFNGPLSPSPTNIGTSPQKTNGSATSPSSLRIPQKPTTPAIPSPLRQTWSQPGDGSPPQPGPSQGQTQRQTMAANFMTELIKDVTPPKRPDVSNPYQTASPVKPPAKPKPKRPRATGKPAPPNGKQDEVGSKQDGARAEKPLSDYSPQAIIEATLPKGSKRSRPTFDASGSEPSLSKDSTLDDDVMMEAQPSKRPEADAASGVSSTQRTVPTITVEPAEDVSASSLAQDSTAQRQAPTPGPVSNKPLFGAPKPSSIPREPSKLRFSYQPDGVSEGSPSSKSDMPPTPKLAPAQIPAASLTFDKLKTSGSGPIVVPEVSASQSAGSLGLGHPSVLSRVHGAPKRAGDPKTAALSIPEYNLPAFAFSFGRKSSATADSAAMKVAKAIPTADLPTFAFSFGQSTTEVTNSTQPPAATSTSSGGFNWTAAGMKPPTSDSSNWTCSNCMLSNPASATDKCTVCDAPRNSALTVPTKSFDWAAAGMKAPTSGAGGSSWTCSVCMLSNPATATEKCTICDEPRP